MWEGHRLVSWDFFSEIMKLLKCKDCGEDISFEESSVRSLGFKLEVNCESCGNLDRLNSCPMVGVQKNAMDVNMRAALAMRM